MAWRKLPLDSSRWLGLDRNPLPYAGLLTSLSSEYDYDCAVEGDLPRLRGTLYRVGPGLYDRGADRRRMMLDGDGMLQALSFGNGPPRFRSRYVRTAKFNAEARAGHFIYPSFSTHGSGPLRYNLGLRLANQANTTVLEWAGRLLAFDEAQRPYELNLALDTIGEVVLDCQQPGLRYWAHWKLDAAHGQLHLLSISQGPRATARIVSLDLRGQIVARQSIVLPRSVYIHDWFVTRHHFAFLLHPAYVDLGRLGQVLIGRETFSEAISWRADESSLLHVARRGDGQSFTAELPASWMWHAINGYEDRGELILDYIGGDIGGGLGDDSSPLFAVMRGEEAMPVGPVNYPRRCRFNLSTRRAEERVIDGSNNYELPTVATRERGLEYRHAYMIQADAGELFARSICQLDGASLTRQSYGFGADEFVSEPVTADYLGGEPGRWVLSQVYNATARRSYFAILDDQNFRQGPIAKIHLRHHVPLSFHGYWSPREVVPSSHRLA